ncbi:MAG TPA: hypothetical protein VGN98_10940 [Tianweitania sediminis]|nr:hypothetical protein [Tianweitania sediminis]
MRLAATLSLILALFLAIGDAARSVAVADWRVTPMIASWLETAPASLEAAKAWVIRWLGEAAWDPAMVSLLALPGFLLFAAMAVVFYALGRSPAPKRGRIARVA